MQKYPLLTAMLLLGLVSLPACATAGRAVVGTVGTAGRVAVGTAGVAGTAAVKTASTGSRVAASAATGAANGAAREGGKLAVRGVAAMGRAGFRAMRRDDSSISEDTLAHRAGLTLAYPREDLSIGNVFEDGDRTDYIALSPDGSAANCYVTRDENTVSDATCQPAP